MTSKRVGKLRDELQKLRAQAADLGQARLEGFAKKLGRVRKPVNTKEPQWVSTLLTGSRPISIPGHRTIKRFTAKSILDDFEADLDRLEELADGEQGEQR